MILTCPNCATRFGVPDQVLQPAGRTVKCGRCAHLWFVAPDGKPALARLPPPSAPAPAPVAETEPPERAATVAAGSDAGAVPRGVEPTPTPSEIVAAARASVARAVPAPGARRWTAPIGWALFVLAVAVLALAIYFHEVMASEYPATRPFYRVTRLMPEMSHDGLKVQKLTVEPDLGQVDARNLPATVTVRGEVVNQSWLPRTIRTLQGQMRDIQRQEIQRWSVETPRHWLWPGQAIAFSSEVPLQGVRPLEIVINLGPLE
jgi:predicted Zn finger-like uncharacterized protein